MLGIDGLEPSVIDLLLAEGKLPAFAKLRREGAYGRLQSMKPLLSPIIWTTVATGRLPDAHRIGHFVAVNESSLARRTSTQCLSATAQGRPSCGRRRRRHECAFFRNTIIQLR